MVLTRSQTAARSIANAHPTMIDSSSFIASWALT